MSRPWLSHYFSLERSSNSIFALDGLRALAIILVLFRHGLVYFEQIFHTVIPPLGYTLIRPLYHNGWMGVDLFFVLSGFLIGSQLLRTIQKEGFRLPQVSRFYANRFFRIVPAYFILLALIQWVFAPNPFFSYKIHPDEVSHWMWAHLLFLQDYFGFTMYPIFWSLGVEEKFYLLTPLLILLGALLLSCWKKLGEPFKKVIQQWPKPLNCLLLLPLLSLPLLSRHLSYQSDPIGTQLIYEHFRITSFHLRFDGLVVGLMCAVLFQHLQTMAPQTQATLAKVLKGIGVLLVLLWVLYQPANAPFSPWTIVYSGTFIALSFGVLLLGCALTTNTTASPWQHPLLCYIARISYSLYLLHDLLVYPVFTGWIELNRQSPVLLQLVPDPDWQTTLILCGFILIYFLCSIGVASVYHFIVEKPFLKLKERLFKLVPAVSA